MFENRSSRLNPLACSFIPSKTTEVSLVREVAEKSVKELIEKKETKGGQAVTKADIANLVGQLITLRYATSNADVLKINSYLSSKILGAEIPSFKTLGKVPVKPVPAKSNFNLMKFKIPELSYLIVAFWGLYRHEQAERPLLSLSYRPEKVTNNTWSVASFDKKLWNPSCVVEVCNCPPVFGYILPLKFDELDTQYTCPRNTIHLNHYPESKEGNEYILTSNWNYAIHEEQPFYEDFEDFHTKLDLEVLTRQFEDIVTDICDLLSEHSKESVQTEDCMTELPIEQAETDDKINEENCIQLWDKNNELETTRAHSKEQTAEQLVDDNEHPLLETNAFEEDEGVSMEIEEMIRRSLSPKKDLNAQAADLAFEDVEAEEPVECDPPCSIWCNSTSKGKACDAAVTIYLQAVPDKEDSDAPSIDLISSEQLEAQKPKPEKFSFADLNPVLDLAGPKNPRPFFRRAFSVNDCDPHYYDMKLGSNGNMAQASNSKELFTFLKKDPVNFFKTFNRSNSWKDTDSGFVSHWSSQEDFYGDRNDQCREDDRESMWGLFSGEDSLWKPLPECTTPTGLEEKPLPHKRIRDLRRQRSLN